jgi:formyl-CoA transferase
LDATPGNTAWPGPEIGSHTDEILSSIGIDTATIEQLKTSGVVTDTV